MSKFFHGLAHVGLIALQVANASSKVIPPPYNIVVAGGFALVQGIIALNNHKTAQASGSPAGN